MRRGFAEYGGKPRAGGWSWSAYTTRGIPSVRRARRQPRPRFGLGSLFAGRYGAFDAPMRRKIAKPRETG